MKDDVYYAYSRLESWCAVLLERWAGTLKLDIHPLHGLISNYELHEDEWGSAEDIDLDLIYTQWSWETRQRASCNSIVLLTGRTCSERLLSMRRTPPVHQVRDSSSKSCRVCSLGDWSNASAAIITDCGFWRGRSHRSSNDTGGKLVDVSSQLRRLTRTHPEVVWTTTFQLVLNASWMRLLSTPLTRDLWHSHSSNVNAVSVVFPCGEREEDEL